MRVTIPSPVTRILVSGVPPMSSWSILVLGFAVLLILLGLFKAWTWAGAEAERRRQEQAREFQIDQEIDDA
jgi:hypothetical protein